MSKTPLVMVPGLLCDERLWGHQLKYLADVADMQVGDTIQDDSVEGMAKRILDNAPDKFALAGLSMGGYVSLEILRQAPERVLKLALIDTSSRQDSDEQKRRRRGLISLTSKGRFKGVTPRLLPMLIHPDRMEDEALTTTVMDMAAQVGQEAFVRQQTAILNRPDSRDDLSGYNIPSLVICGRQDEVTPLALSEESSSLLPNSRLCIIEECGHLATLERPFATTALMRDWLENW
ncbi:alpha/beta fold hydrolase [Curvivirga sp.]|uniref:alpha/beta fold hydrolase n=1 Tax=Curvivirga sp. TaxID=2856848 RepID=UPI003B58CC63